MGHEQDAAIQTFVMDFAQQPIQGTKQDEGGFVGNMTAPILAGGVKPTAGAYTPAVAIPRKVNTSICLLQNKFY